MVNNFVSYIDEDFINTSNYFPNNLRCVNFRKLPVQSKVDGGVLLLNFQ